MNQLLDTLEKIELRCLDDKLRKEKEMEEKKLDDFDRLKNKIWRQIREYKKIVSEREKLLQKDEGIETVRLGAEARDILRQVKKDTKDLEDIQKKTEKKLKKKQDKGKEIPKDIMEDVETRAEIVDLC